MGLFMYESIILFKHVHYVILLYSVHCQYVCQFVYLLVCLPALTSKIAFLFLSFFDKLVLFLYKQNVLKSCDITSFKGYTQTSLCPFLSPSIRQSNGPP